MYVYDCHTFFLLCFVITSYFIFFFFNDTATTEIYTLSLHDALPISAVLLLAVVFPLSAAYPNALLLPPVVLFERDRKSTRLNSSHDQISYAVFCLKKKKQTEDILAGI